MGIMGKSNSSYWCPFSLYRLNDLKPVWARLTALIVTDVSAPTENSGKRICAPYVNARSGPQINIQCICYIHHIYSEMSLHFSSLRPGCQSQFNAVAVQVAIEVCMFVIYLIPKVVYRFVWNIAHGFGMTQVFSVELLFMDIMFSCTSVPPAQSISLYFCENFCVN